MILALEMTRRLTIIFYSLSPGMCQFLHWWLENYEDVISYIIDYKKLATSN